MGVRRPKRQVILYLVLTAIALACVTLTTGIVLVRSKIITAIDLSERVQESIKERDLQRICPLASEASAAWTDVAQVTLPFEGILRHLGWLPRVGPDIVLLPQLVRFAQSGSAAANAACPLLLPVITAETLHERVTLLATQIAEHGSRLDTLELNLEAANDAWKEIDEQIDPRSVLARYHRQLEQFGTQLPVGIELVRAIRQAGPSLPWLFGIDGPRHYLIVTQNPYELRPTGGFWGLICQLRIYRAELTVEGCIPSEEYEAAWPDQTEMPEPYRRYLQLNAYYLRDANWPADFGAAATRLQRFWTMNGASTVDGVIAIDPFTFVPLLEATGPLKLPDRTQVDAQHVVDFVLESYYDGTRYRDKARLGSLLPIAVERLLKASSDDTLHALTALQHMARERHLLMAFNNRSVASAMAMLGWDGSLHPHEHASLRIVDADLGYAKVNGFVERLSQYDVELNREGVPLTATLILTYTNRYSPWAEAPTSHSVYGLCATPPSLVLTRQPGCYANFVRIYAPPGSELLSLTGLDETYPADKAYSRSVFGGYLLILAGEQRTVRLKYRLPRLAAGRLDIEKQPGTGALPFLVGLHSPTTETMVTVSAQSDIHINYQVTPSGTIVETAGDAAASELFARGIAFNNGLTQWTADQRTAAISTWHHGAVLDRAIDYARMIGLRGNVDGALALLEAISATTRDGRALFEQAALLETRGEFDAANTHYQQAAARSPDNPLAQLVWARIAIAEGYTLPSLVNVGHYSGAVRRWMRTAAELRTAGNDEEARLYINVLRWVPLSEPSQRLSHADLLLQAGERDAALALYAQLADTDDVWGIIAQAVYAQQTDRPEDAVEAYIRVLQLTTDNTIAYRIGIALRELGATQAALNAFEHAADLAPTSVAPLLAAGDLLRSTDVTAARQWYERALVLDQSSGAPDFALGRLLLEAGDRLAARRYLEAAVAKQPGLAEYHDELAKVQ